MTIENELKRIADALETLIAQEEKTFVVSKEASDASKVVREDAAGQQKKRGRKPAATDATPTPASDKEESGITVTKDVVRAALSGLKDRQVGMQILAEFSCRTLSELPEDQYAAVLKAVNKAKKDE